MLKVKNLNHGDEEEDKTVFLPITSRFVLNAAMS